MRIREEIKRLRGIAHYGENDSYISKADVLSILDEHLGELVAEGPLTQLLATRISDLIERNVHKGDTIIIYRRKKK